MKKGQITTKEQERELIEAMLAGDRHAFRTFYRTYTPQLLSFIRRKIGSEADVEEIAQDSLFACLEGLRDFTHQSSLKTFLFSIASHKIADFYRKKRLKRIVFSQLGSVVELFEAEAGNPEEVYAHTALRQKITQVFARLTPEYAQILRFKYIEGKSVVEIARQLSVSFKSAESLLFRARRAFVKMYSEQ